MKEVDYSKTVVAIASRQHSFQVAEALEKEGMLYRYVTTVYDSEKSFWMKVVKHLIGGANLKRAESRKMKTVADEKVIQYYELGGLLILLLLRIDKKGKFTDWVSRHVASRFEKKVAKFIIKEGVGVVITYDLNASVLFDVLKKKAPQVIRIMDDSALVRNYMYKLYQENRAASGEFAKTYEKFKYLSDENYAEYLGEEARKADLHIVASTIAKKSVLYNGFSDDRIIFAPYGVDTEKFAPSEKDYQNGLKILFVGNINQGKGIAQILEAAKELKEENYNIEFEIVGPGKDAFPELYAPYEGCVNFRKMATADELKVYYGSNHVFAFPSLGEGFGLVILEALSAGLPVIASRNCGGPDVIQEGYNGFLIDAGSTSQLKDRILWFYEHMDKLPEMQANAVQSAKDFTWEKYEERLTSQLKEKIAYMSEIKKG